MLGEAGTCALGIVCDAAAGAVSLAALDGDRRSLTVETLPVSPADRDQLGLFWGEGVPQGSADAELRTIEETLCRLCPDRTPAPVLVAVPAMYLDPAFAENVRPPYAVIRPGSPLLKVLFALATSGRAVFLNTVLNLDDPNSPIAVRRVPDSELAEDQRQRLPLFLAHDMLTACTELLAGAPASAGRAAAMAALVAAWPSSYSYWSSFGRVFSSVDLVSCLRRGQSRTLLFSGSERLAVRWNPRRNQEIVDEVALEHALGMQRHSHLQEADALKAALVHLGKVLGITVTCSSTRADARTSKYTEVWPPREPFAWAIDLVRQQP